MARHYHDDRCSGDVFKLAVLLVVAAALVFVLCRLYPRSMPCGMVAASDKIVAVVAQLKSSFRAEKPAEVEKPALPPAQKSASEPTKQAKDKKQQESVPDQPETSENVSDDEGRPLLAIIVDDGGDQLKLTRRVAALDLPLTWAIMPNCKYTGKTAAIADVKGAPYILHLPMQALTDKDGGPYLAGEDISSADIAKNTSDCLDQLPNAVGLSNHRGSLATSRKELIEPVLEILRQRRLLFFDSRTSAESVAYSMAKELGLPAAQNSLFLDNEADTDAVSAKFDEAVKIAERRGSAAVICHFRPASVRFLERLDKKYKSLPVRLVTLPTLVKITSAHHKGTEKAE